jgi:hypothetical protein
MMTRNEREKLRVHLYNRRLLVEAKTVIRMPRHHPCLPCLANTGGATVGELVPNIVRLVPLLRPTDLRSQIT